MNRPCSNMNWLIVSVRWRILLPYLSSRKFWKIRRKIQWYAMKWVPVLIPSQRHDQITSRQLRRWVLYHHHPQFQFLRNTLQILKEPFAKHVRLQLTKLNGTARKKARCAPPSHQTQTLSRESCSTTDPSFPYWFKFRKELHLNRSRPSGIQTYQWWSTKNRVSIRCSDHGP